MIVHFTNNALGILMGWCAANNIACPSGLGWAIREHGDAWSYEPTWTAISALISIAMIMILFNRSEGTRQVVLAEMA
jgi:hypothetical protein